MEVESKLIDLVKSIYERVDHSIGYPICQIPKTVGFSDWYTKTGLCDIATNNAGNPFDEEQLILNASAVEKEVILAFAKLYDIPEDKAWGFVTNGGTDGNMHGIYFGAKKLQHETGMLPLVYISKEAHYSASRICDVQNLETRMIDCDKMGRMDPESFRKNLDPSKPALVVFAIGSTFMGAIDDQYAIQEVLDDVKPIAVYKHLDGALFGGYLPYTEHKNIVSMEKHGYDSIAISGHKFYGTDDPCGLFLSRKDVLEAQNAAKVAYLNADMPLISCSRSALAPLKLYWILQHHGFDSFVKDAAFMLENAKYFKQRFDEIGYPAWLLPDSNTVFFKRPPEWIRKKYCLANGYLPDYGGDVSHSVVMQHVTKAIIDEFISDLQKKD